MISQFRNNLKNHCSKKDVIIAGISGGADSIALLHLLHASGYKNIVVAHVDHGLRRTSKKDAELVEKYSEKFGYIFELTKIDLKTSARKNRMGIEEAGRKARYEFFRKLKREYNAKIILTAHHADDNIETMFLNLIRGAGVQGLSGLKLLTEDVLRPLLNAEKRELISHCRKHRLKFNEDITNKDTEYARNFVRHEIIPKVKKLNPNFKETLITTANIFSELQFYLHEETEKFLKRQKPNRYSLEEFRHCPLALQSEIIRTLYRNRYENTTDLTANHVMQILKVLNQKKSGKIKEFGKDYVMRTEYYFFSLEKK
jgi:tRNA(Ile)-lysidine synthase